MNDSSSKKVSPQYILIKSLFLKSSIFKKRQHLRVSIFRKDWTHSTLPQKVDPFDNSSLTRGNRGIIHHLTLLPKSPSLEVRIERSIQGVFFPSTSLHTKFPFKIMSSPLRKSIDNVKQAFFS